MGENVANTDDLSDSFARDDDPLAGVFIKSWVYF
jgi:hypothetical protein